MKIAIWLLLFVSACWGCRSQPSLDKTVDSIALSYMSGKNTVGLCIGVLKDGKTHFYSYGESVKGSGKPPKPGTLFEIGSISKTFTSTLLGMAVVSGKVRLDDTVNKYLPDSIPLLQFSGKVVRLRDLANHSSGIPRMPSNFGESAMLDLQDPYRNYSVEKLYSFLKHLQLNRAPGTVYEYSNVAVGTLGVILQKIYGMSYEEMVTGMICLPLGMHDTRIVIRAADSAAFAKGYDINGNYASPWNLPPAFAGAGAIRSTARDMLLYAAGNLGAARGTLGRAIQLTHDTTFTDGKVTLGLGWHYGPAGSEKVLWHNGGTGGFRTFLGFHAGKKLAVVALANSNVSPEVIGGQILEWLIKKG